MEVKLVEKTEDNIQAYYDLVIEMDSELKKVQIKTTSEKNPAGNPVVGLRLVGGNSKVNFVQKMAQDIIYDFLYVLTDAGDRYFLPKSAIENITTKLTLGKKYIDYKI